MNALASDDREVANNLRMTDYLVPEGRNVYRNRGPNKVLRPSGATRSELTGSSTSTLRLRWSATQRLVASYKHSAAPGPERPYSDLVHANQFAYLIL